jgi:thymidylate synthase
VVGVPYDVFNFSMVTHFICSLLNQSREHDPYEPGTLFLTMASSHIYQENFEAALSCLKSTSAIQQMTPKPSLDGSDLKP